MAKKDSVETTSFEKNIEELERVLGELEKGELPLENQLQLFESGIALSRTCLQKLEAVEKRVEQLVINAQGDMTTKPFDPPPENPC